MMMTNKKILIIDDDKSFRRIVEFKLNSFLDKPTYTQFDNITKAREHLISHSKEEFDLVVLDHHLPDGRGLELLYDNLFGNTPVLMVSSDTAPEVPGSSVLAGATFFISKISVSEPLFRPLVEGIIDRTALKHELQLIKDKTLVMDTIKTLVSTLRHEINNPLGAVLGAAYLMKNNKDASPDQKDAAELVESSGKRIKHVLDELCKAIELDSIKKAHEKVFHIPGDKPWGSE